ncbi:MAG: hypothetical protein CMD04_00060 [Flavobacteriales bacterium]|nr:hypothetical protein [Flavobacteriales bacterium]|tara:strand:+ start:252 stop:467 length:216 start_codon:yes stop_codon:yes gene_type:complete
MKIDKSFILSFVAPIMILVSIIGLISRPNNKKIFYLPIGLIGIFIILEKDVTRKLNRQRMLEKIKSYRKVR